MKLRHELEDFLSERLGWTGLGHCDGGSIGSGTMEVACFVVEKEVSKSVVEKSLKVTKKFSKFNRIYFEE